VSEVLQYLLDLVARLGPWSYVIIFAAALECAAFVGLIEERWIGRTILVLAAAAALVAVVAWRRRCTRSPLHA
jgi:hypothetical protein